MSVALERRHKHRGVRKRGAVLLETTAAINSHPMPTRQKPNILITGTPGTGKTTHSELVAAEAGLQHVNIGALVREHELYDGYNEEFEAYFVNDDKVLPAFSLFLPVSAVAASCLVHRAEYSTPFDALWNSSFSALLVFTGAEVAGE